ncbi:hypothetical protein BJF79_13760 [Actinomadura sp. CNU-125]|uniref:hypothetical protein n=1 Tax=Actinomadura sp. CNU-125 TaxID=1904961 RepID=UPI00095DFC04|nr:hypothetical protein [Actinomadura sp. CNU-125]OLT24403.1 hypothetical protein BJF79_13760 [Actinomadura sp. CNU-125]
MAISEEEQKLREEARKAILQSAKGLAEKVPNLSATAPDNLRAAAEAYAIVVGDDEDEDEPDAGGTY